MSRLGLFESLDSVKSQFLPAVSEGVGVFAGISAAQLATSLTAQGISMLPDAVPQGVKDTLTAYAAPAVPLAVGLFVMPMVERKVSNPHLTRGLRGVRMGMIAFSVAKLVGPYLNQALTAASLPAVSLAGYGGPGLGVDHYLNGAPVTVSDFPTLLRGAPVNVEKLNGLRGAPVTVSPVNPIGKVASVLGG